MTSTALLQSFSPKINEIDSHEIGHKKICVH